MYSPSKPHFVRTLHDIDGNHAIDISQDKHPHPEILQEMEDHFLHIYRDLSSRGFEHLFYTAINALKQLSTTGQRALPFNAHPETQLVFDLLEGEHLIHGREYTDRSVRYAITHQGFDILQQAYDVEKMRWACRNIDSASMGTMSISSIDMLFVRHLIRNLASRLEFNQVPMRVQEIQEEINQTLRQQLGFTNRFLAPPAEA